MVDLGYIVDIEEGIFTCEFVCDVDSTCLRQATCSCGWMRRISSWRRRTLHAMLKQPINCWQNTRYSWHFYTAGLLTACGSVVLLHSDWTILVAWWHNGWDVGLAIERSWVRFPVGPLSSNNSRCASVTKQYNLVPAKGRWRSTARKVTMDLVSHWPSITDFVIYPPTGSMA